ncbi:unnamed protein product [Spirodela intermedia]|uniref:Uncharacterized protein n=1 Tax=Spirodela intermedia TaxID=51605 RepID=A0A7I8JQS8_SPIIN|nr:unnamed protein product [Spirodela intermedia]CAA6672486.1 unnamed protein product [Spirodela intermedia]
MRPQRKEQAFEMTIRENAFPEDTQWSEGEARVMKEFWTQLVQVLSPDIIFIADPEGTIIGGSSVVPQFLGQSTAEMRLVGALREVLTGGHLGFEEAYCLAFDGEPEEQMLKFMGSNTHLSLSWLTCHLWIPFHSSGYVLEAYPHKIGKNISNYPAVGSPSKRSCLSFVNLPTSMGNDSRRVPDRLRYRSSTSDPISGGEDLFSYSTDLKHEVST